MYSCITSYGISGIDAYAVAVEVTINRAMPMFDIVGLPDAAVRESRSRVQSTIIHGGYEMPVAKITVNLAPASQKKSGPAFDLPIFLAIMSASGQIEPLDSQAAFVGELSLSGQLRSINGVLSMALQARQDGIKALFVPEQNAREASIVEGLQIYPVREVSELFEHFSGRQPIGAAEFDPMLILEGSNSFEMDLRRSRVSHLPAMRWKSPQPEDTTCC